MVFFFTLINKRILLCNRYKLLKLIVILIIFLHINISPFFQIYRNISQTKLSQINLQRNSTKNDVSASNRLRFVSQKIASWKKKFRSTYLCVLGADVDRRDVIDDVLDGPAIHGLSVAAGHVSIERRTPDWRRCDWSRGRFRLGRYAFGSSCFRSLPLARCETTGTRKVQRTRHSRVSFVRTCVSNQNVVT